MMDGFDDCLQVGQGGLGGEHRGGEVDGQHPIPDLAAERLQ